MDSKEPITNTDSVIARSTKTKNKLKSGSLQEGDRCSVDYLDGILHIINLWMALVMQSVFNDKNFRGNTVPDSKDFNSESLATQANKAEKPVSMMTAKKKLLILWVSIQRKILQKKIFYKTIWVLMMKNG